MDRDVEGMTRQEAEEIIVALHQGPRELVKPKHFYESQGDESYTPQDLYYILRAHKMEPGAPEWREERSAYRVRIRGNCLEGRPTIVVLDLRKEGSCVAVSIMQDKRGRTRK